MRSHKDLLIETPCEGISPQPRAPCMGINCSRRTLCTKTSSVDRDPERAQTEREGNKERERLIIILSENYMRDKNGKERQKEKEKKRSLTKRESHFSRLCDYLCLIQSHAPLLLIFFLIFLSVCSLQFGVPPSALFMPVSQSDQCSVLRGSVLREEYTAIVPWRNSGLVVDSDSYGSYGDTSSLEIELIGGYGSGELCFLRTYSLDTDTIGVTAEH